MQALSSRAKNTNKICARLPMALAMPITLLSSRIVISRSLSMDHRHWSVLVVSNMVHPLWNTARNGREDVVSTTKSFLDFFEPIGEVWLYDSMCFIVAACANLAVKSGKGFKLEHHGENPVCSTRIQFENRFDGFGEKAVVWNGRFGQNKGPEQVNKAWNQLVPVYLDLEMPSTWLEWLLEKSKAKTSEVPSQSGRIVVWSRWRDEYKTRFGPTRIDAATSCSYISLSRSRLSVKRLQGWRQELCSSI